MKSASYFEPGAYYDPGMAGQGWPYPITAPAPKPTYFEPGAYYDPAYIPEEKTGWAGSLWDSLQKAGKTAVEVGKFLGEKYVEALKARPMDQQAINTKYAEMMDPAAPDIIRLDYPGPYTPYQRKDTGTAPTPVTVTTALPGGIPPILLLGGLALFLMMKGGKR